MVGDFYSTSTENLKRIIINLSNFYERLQIGHSDRFGSCSVNPRDFALTSGLSRFIPGVRLDASRAVGRR